MNIQSYNHAVIYSVQIYVIYIYIHLTVKLYDYLYKIQ